MCGIAGLIAEKELVVRDARGREEHHGPVRFVPLRGQAGFRG